MGLTGIDGMQSVVFYVCGKRRVNEKQSFSSPRLVQSSAKRVRQMSSLWLCFPVLQKKGVPASERAGEERARVLYWVC